MPTQPDLFALASLIGGLSFALSGFLIGVRKELDFMGIFIVSMLSSNGGGAVRDVLVGRLPEVLRDSSAFLIVLGVIAAALILRLHRRAWVRRSRVFVLCDSLGLTAFSVTGALVGLETGLGLFGVMVLAFITATGGGIIRDLMVNDVPAVLSSDFYGTIALLVGASLWLLNRLELDNSTTTSAAFVVALTLRLLAYRYGWRLPRLTMNR